MHGNGLPAQRHAMYGIAEIADALGVGRQLVAAWRRRRSHGMPEPDAELASGPVWLGPTIEPWIEALPVRPSGGPSTATDAEIRQVARRSLRLLALLLEERPRIQLITRALDEARELLDLAPEVPDDRDATRRALAAVLRPLRRARPEPNSSDLVELRVELVAVLPGIADLLDGSSRRGQLRGAAG
jgi:transcriptional regulator with XRE-family HTH domain